MTLNFMHKDNKKFILTDFVSLRTLQRLQDNLANALGISLVIVDVHSREYITKRSNETMFCSKMKKFVPFLNGCDTDGIKCVDKCVSFNKPFIYKCHADLYGFGVPIMVSGQLSAYFKGGQVRLSNPDIARCKELADKYKVDFDELLEMYLSVPLFTEDKLNATTELLSVIANTVSNLAFSGQLVKTQSTEVVHLNDLLEKEVMRKTEELRLSEQKYRNIFENALDIIYTIDKNGVFTHINEIIHDVLGYEKNEVLGKHFSEFVSPEDLKTVSDSFIELKRHKRTSTKGLKFRIKSKSGESTYFELNSTASYDADLDLESITGFLHNVDQSLKAEAKLEAVKEKYKELFDSMKMGVYMTDENGRIKAFNKAALNMLGYFDFEEVSDMSILSLYVNPLDRKSFLSELPEKGFLEDYIVNLKKKDGTPVYVSVTANELKDRSGKVKGVEGVFRDVTKRVNLEREIELMKQYLENLIASAGCGIAGIDKDRKIFLWNKGAEELFGYKSSDVIGRDLFAIIPRDLRTHRPDLFRRVSRGEVVSGIEIQSNNTPDGKAININVTISPIKDANGNVIGASAIAGKNENV